MEAVDKALELRPDYFEALTYKNLLSASRRRLEKNPAKQQELIKQADELQKKAIDVRNLQTKGAGGAGRPHPRSSPRLEPPPGSPGDRFSGRLRPSGRNRPLSFQAEGDAALSTPVRAASAIATTAGCLIPPLV